MGKMHAGMPINNSISVLLTAWENYIFLPKAGQIEGCIYKRVLYIFGKCILLFCYFATVCNVQHVGLVTKG